MGKKALGKGLEALIAGETEIEESNIREIEIDKIIPNKDQPRKSFDDKQIDELAKSIKENGIIQPIILRNKGEKYEIVVGERRYRAALKAGLRKIPALIKDYSDSKLIEIALIENIQRKDLNPIEEALAYKTIIERDTITQEELSKRIGKSRSYIANMIRLLDLPNEVKEFVSRGTITVGHAKAVMSLEDKNKQIELAKRIVEEDLSVREAEAISQEKRIPQNVTQNVPRGTKTAEPAKGEKLLFVKQLEEKLIGKLGTKVKIKYRNGRGSIVIEFFSDEELDRLLENLT